MDEPRYVLTRHRNRYGYDERTLQRGLRQGRFVRLRCGAFVPTALWRRLSWSDRRRLEIEAAAEMLGERFVASHRSAAVLLGIPVLRRPDDPVHIRATLAAGTRTEHGYRKHAVRDVDQHRTVIDGMGCTALERTVLDLAATEPFEEGVIAADWALANGTTKDGLRRTLDEWAPARGRGRIERVIAFGVANSGSAGESWSRAQMEEGGLLIPHLQTEFTDAHGLIGFVDFFWPEIGLVGEFDGLKKYKEAELRGGRDAGQVVSDEKIREDRLRATRTHPRVARWDWSTLTSRTLVRQLRSTGVPIR